MGRRIIEWVGVSVSALFASTMIGGCGSDEDRLTTEEFLEQANAICATGEQAIEEAAAELAANSEPSAEEFGSFIEDTWAPAVQTLLDDLEDLNPPEGLEDDVDTYLAEFQAAVDQTVDDAASNPEALLAGDTDDPFVDVDAQATEMGLTACGGG